MSGKKEPLVVQIKLISKEAIVNNMNILITGGLGQIGSHVAELFLERGDQVVVIDNLATGRKEHLKDHANLKIFIDTIANKKLMEQVFDEFKPDAVVHAACSYKDPDDWYNDTMTNCVGGSILVDAAKASGGKKIYLLSNCALLWFETRGTANYVKPPKKA